MKEFIPGEIVFHFRGDTATAINFKNIMTLTEIMDEFGANIYLPYMSLGVCYYGQDSVVGHPDFTVRVYNPLNDPSEKNDLPMLNVEVHPWEKFPADVARNIQSAMEIANKKLAALLAAQEIVQEKEKSDELER
jgi:hypothetical protein